VEIDVRSVVEIDVRFVVVTQRYVVEIDVRSVVEIDVRLISISVVEIDDHGPPFFFYGSSRILFPLRRIQKGICIQKNIILLGTIPNNNKFHYVPDLRIAVPPFFFMDLFQFFFWQKGRRNTEP